VIVCIRKAVSDFVIDVEGECVRKAGSVISVDGGV
jgi:hypothetical protein